MGSPPFSAYIETNSDSVSAIGPPVVKELHPHLGLCKKTDVDCSSCFRHGWKYINQNIELCGILLIAISLIVDGQLDTLLKCSANFFKITSLYVRSVLLVLSSGVAPELFGP